jgi:hypothetical protein
MPDPGVQAGIGDPVMWGIRNKGRFLTLKAA